MANRKVVVGPMTRVNGMWEIHVTLDGQNRVVEARSASPFWRGMELILQSRDPRDAPYLTERICGICSSAHGYAASLALEEAAGVEPPPNGILVRNVLLGADFLQNHIRHFYFLHMPAFVAGPEQPPFAPRFTTDLRIPRRVSETIYQGYFRAIDESRRAHELAALFSGKVPHGHGVVAGGATVHPDSEKILRALGMVSKLRSFIDEHYLPDVERIAEYYPDYFSIGGGTEGFFSFGAFPQAPHKKKTAIPGGVMLEGRREELDLSAIEEHVRFSYYDQESRQHPAKGTTEVALEKPGAYTFVKAPRYKGRALETGPIARMWFAGRYREEPSTLSRTVARALEARLIVDLIEEWLLAMDPSSPVFEPFEVPEEGRGVGILGAMRGALGHWVEISSRRIARYQIITPSAWNCSPSDDTGRPSPVEAALLGVQVQNPEEPVELGRIVRSFDPCLSCATHVIKGGRRLTSFQII